MTTSCSTWSCASRVVSTMVGSALRSMTWKRVLSMRWTLAALAASAAIWRCGCLMSSARASAVTTGPTTRCTASPPVAASMVHHWSGPDENADGRSRMSAPLARSTGSSSSSSYTATCSGRTSMVSVPPSGKQPMMVDGSEIVMLTRYPSSGGAARARLASSVPGDVEHPDSTASAASAATGARTALTSGAPGCHRCGTQVPAWRGRCRTVAPASPWRSTAPAEHRGAGRRRRGRRVR